MRQNSTFIIPILNSPRNCTFKSISHQQLTKMWYYCSLDSKCPIFKSISLLTTGYSVQTKGQNIFSLSHFWIQILWTWLFQFKKQNNKPSVLRAIWSKKCRPYYEMFHHFQAISLKSTWILSTWTCVYSWLILILIATYKNKQCL